MAKVTKLKQEEEAENIYFGGLPTDFEIQKIREEYPKTKLVPGFVIRYADIEKILGISWRESRFKTVMNRWRAMMRRESAIYVEPKIPGVSYKILTETEKVDLMKKEKRASEKKNKKTYVIGTHVDTKNLSDETKAEVGFLMMLSAKVKAVSQMKTGLALPEM